MNTITTIKINDTVKAANTGYGRVTKVETDLFKNTFVTFVEGENIGLHVEHKLNIKRIVEVC